MSKRPVEEDSELSAWALLTLDEESQAQVQRLFQLLDADKSGTLSQADFADRPQHWAAVCSALTVEPGTATLSLAGFIAGIHTARSSAPLNFAEDLREKEQPMANCRVRCLNLCQF